ncbi:type I-E CRISPR-associated protein Cas5/CasD [Streptomyces sp. NPDC008001]|uniref:type I-E CRISPR-associated protein Cas5/CasD n=1 Tax=Streptomyces sp. NPDC008001 TaxID=3364804 RepID=UPI0036E5CB11
MSSSEPPSRGLLLHLAGPLQSWGTHSRFNERDTARFPTRSGIIGMLAACLGRRRGEPLEDLAGLSLTTRTDRPGVLLRDLHTVGGGLPPKATVTTAEGKKRPPSQGTLLSQRYYLADAAFTAALTSPDHRLLTQCAESLRSPQWPPYLGRRSCPPEGPLLIGLLSDPFTHLVNLPLARQANQNNTMTDFHSDAPLGHLNHHLPHSSGPDSLDGSTPSGEVTDDPLSLSPRRRAYRARPLYQRSLALPAGQCGGLGPDYLQALARYLTRHTTEGTGA